MENSEKLPVVGVGAVVLQYDSVLLVKRATSPSAGLWAIPGGKQRWGETMQQAAEREVLEETGVQIKAGSIVHAFDLLLPEEGDQEAVHYVIIDLAAEYVGGEVSASDEVSDVAWVSAMALRTMDVDENTKKLLTDLGFL